MKKNQPSRREFLKTSTVAAAGAAAVSTLGVARSAHAAGDDLIQVVQIGCGGRANGAIRQRIEVGDNVKVVAVADAFEGSAKGNAHNLREDEKYKNKVDLPDDRVFWGTDAYKKAIDVLKPGDQIVVATPPGFRPFHYRYAVQRGLHVFMEKPCCVDADGFQILQEANKIADEKNLKVMVGLQRRHDPGFQQFIEQINKGTIGDVLFSRVYWNGGGIWQRNREPGESEVHFQIRNWYHFVWLCGDNITEQHVHNLDIGLWMHSKGDQMCHPVECNAMGGRQNTIPYELRREAPPFADRKAWDEWYQKYKGQFGRHGEAWDHFFCEYTFADGSKMFSQCRHIPNTWGSVSNWVHGSKGHGSVEGGAWLKGYDGADLYKGPANAGQFSYEHKVHADAIRGEKKLWKEDKMNYGWNGALSSFTACLGRYAAQSGKVVKWDEAAAKGVQAMPTDSDGIFDMNSDNAPVKPDADGFYESSVAKEGVYNPFKS
ncbi:MAG: Gfo/Idh/MocA family oxidoreductase [Planctomycetaceae bacterium]|jgi:predicted dehydrogenase|nr:Gfo/Idh/MocA family oxidoreductase [Planctomycetaceae bacterium]